MAITLQNIVDSTSKNDFMQPALRRVVKQEGDFSFFLFYYLAGSFQQLYKWIPASWGRSRARVELCTIWVADQTHRLVQIGSFSSRLLLAAAQVLKHPVGTWKKLAGAAKLAIKRSACRVSKPSARVPVLLDVSGAENLSPAFLAACIISLSGAGFSVSFKMTGNEDPCFPMIHLVELLQVMALGCSLNVRLQVTEMYYLLRHLKLSSSQNQRLLQLTQKDWRKELIASLSDIVHLAGFTEYSGSEAAHRILENQHLDLAILRGQIEAAIGNRSLDVSKPTIACETVVFENLLKVKPLLLHELEEYVCSPASDVFFVFRDTILQPEGYRSLCKLIAASKARSVCFQQLVEFSNGWTPQKDNAVLGSRALQKSKTIQALELDFLLTADDLDSVRAFLLKSELGPEIVIHLRPSSYVQNPDAVSGLFEKLEEVLSLSNWGSRLTVVHHGNQAGRHSARLATQLADKQTAFTAFHQDVISRMTVRLRTGDFAMFLDVFMIIIFGADLFLTLISLLGWTPFGFNNVPAGIIPGHSGPLMFRFIWKPLRAILLGNRDYVGLATGVALVFVPNRLFYMSLAMKAFLLYLGFCLAVTLLRQLARSVIGSTNAN